MKQSVVRRGEVCITLRVEGLAQQLLIPATPQGERLAELLLEGTPQQEGDYFVVLHSPDVDRRIADLVDALTAVRWAHPTFTQLTLDLLEGTTLCRPNH